MNMSIGLRIAASACRRFLTSLYTTHAQHAKHAQMEQIFQSIYATYATGIIVLSQCRCLPPGVGYCHRRLQTGEKRQDQEGSLAFIASNYSDGKDGKEITYVYGVTVCWPTSKRQRAYCICILHIIYGRPWLAMSYGLFAICRVTSTFNTEGVGGDQITASIDTVIMGIYGKHYQCFTWEKITAKEKSTKQVTGYRLQVTGYRLQVTRNKEV